MSFCPASSQRYIRSIMLLSNLFCDPLFGAWSGRMGGTGATHGNFQYPDILSFPCSFRCWHVVCFNFWGSDCATQFRCFNSHVVCPTRTKQIKRVLIEVDASTLCPFHFIDTYFQHDISVSHVYLRIMNI